MRRTGEDSFDFTEVYEAPSYLRHLEHNTSYGNPKSKDSENGNKAQRSNSGQSQGKQGKS